VHEDAVGARLEGGGHGEAEGVAVGRGGLQRQRRPALALQARRAAAAEVQALAQHPQPAAGGGRLAGVALHPPRVGGVEPDRRGRRAVRDDAARHRAGLPVRRNGELEGGVAGLEDGDAGPRPGLGPRAGGRGGAVVQPRHLDDGLPGKAAALQQDRLVGPDGVGGPEDPRLGGRGETPRGEGGGQRPRPHRFAPGAHRQVPRLRQANRRAGGPPPRSRYNVPTTRYCYPDDGPCYRVFRIRHQEGAASASAEKR
jgi:hypothetical protein